jgi:Zn-dependent protease
VHKDRLESLAAQAAVARDAGRRADALALWREALELLPPDTRQAEVIQQRIAGLREEVDASPAAAPESDAGARAEGQGSIARQAGMLGVLALVIWKFKFLIVVVASKLKFLLFGLSKGSTLLSMLGFLGVYWAIWGWWFALGLAVSIYVHEMGHVAALTRYGIRASAPMFIPGLGALIRLRQYPVDPIEDARVGLAGPVWGLGAAAVAYAVSVATGAALWAAIAKLGAWINLFNMLPLGQLDGGRGFRALCRWQRWVACAMTGALFALTGEGLLVLIALVGAARAFAGDCPARPGGRAFAETLGLLVALTVLSAVRVDGVATTTPVVPGVLESPAR